MNASLITLEIAVIVLGLVVLLLDLWTPSAHKRTLGYLAAGAVALIFVGSLFMTAAEPRYAFGTLYVLDPLALFFKRFFLLAAVLVLLIAVEFSDRIESGIAEFYSLILFALTGMMFAASANDLLLLFVSLELITVTFYVLNSFQRRKTLSLEAGVKYLILGAMATAFTVYGIAIMFGVSNTTSFDVLAANAATLAGSEAFLLGLLLVFAGLGFKMAAFPFQIWAPDVYQGSPAPATAFLAVGSKAAGVVLLIRILFSAVPEVAVNWGKVLMFIAGATILYGNLCAIPQRNLKRLLGYSSIAQAGYILLGISAMSALGVSAVVFYLAAYLFTVLAAFMVIAVVMRQVEGEDISVLAGLHHRSPLLAAAMGLSMISLAGIPPLAGFFGKFLLLKAVIEQGPADSAYYWLVGVALVGVVISFYYYLGVVRAIYWSDKPADPQPILVSLPVKAVLAVCLFGMLFLGLYPSPMVDASDHAAQHLQFAPEQRSAQGGPALGAAGSN
jgi:NADH-quinone oxidoreductase subunit N